MANFKRILIHTNEDHIDHQRNFLTHIATLMNGLRVAYKEFDLGELDLNDLADLVSLEPIDLMKRKSQSELKGVEIKGMRIKPDKLFDMLDLDHSRFILLAVEFKSEIKKIHIADSNRRYWNEFSAKFFIEDGKGSLKINEDHLTKWCETHCQIYTKSEEQNLTFAKIKNLTNSLNELKGHIQHPKELAEINNDFERMLFFDQGTFKVNRKYFL